MTVASGSSRSRRTTYDLTVLGTSDIHGHVYNWDYYRDAEYADSAHNAVGVAKLATLVRRIRAERAGRATLVLDAGDTIEGTLLTTYYAVREPITVTGARHPMAEAMNLLDYDAVTLGNHEFNYGLPLLAAWIGQLGCPALAANALDPLTGEPAFTPYLIKEVRLGAGVPALRVGILGLTNPGTAIWDRGQVEGRLRFEDMVDSAAKWVPVLRDRGAELVLVSAHGGDSGHSSYGPELPNENPCAFIAERVPGIDAILFGHAHVEVAQRFVTNGTTGEPVLLSEPSKWGQRLTRMDFTLRRERGRWRIVEKRAVLLNTNTVEEDPAVLVAVRGQHERTIRYANQVVTRSAVELSAAESRYRDTPIVDFVHRVQIDTVVPPRWLARRTRICRCCRSPRRSVGPRCFRSGRCGSRTSPDSISTTTLLRRCCSPAPRCAPTWNSRPDTSVPSARTPRSTRRRSTTRACRTTTTTRSPGWTTTSTSAGRSVSGSPGWSIGGGLEGRSPNGRTERPVAEDERFVVAVNNYRRDGGGNFPGIVKPQVYNERREIRQLLIEYAQARGGIDPADFHRPNWRLVRAGVPVF